MRILFLDDNEKRRNVAIDRYAADHELHVVETADQAIDALLKFPAWDRVLLDHDLGGQVFQNSFESNTGMEVVRFILRTKPIIDQIIVHSWNMPAGREMTNKLKDAGYTAAYQPFEV